MELLFKQLKVLINIKSNQRGLLEDLLPTDSKFKAASPIKNGFSELVYSINPVTEEEKEAIEKKLFLIGIKEYSFQG
jgi:hypothetical protein